MTKHYLVCIFYEIPNGRVHSFLPYIFSYHRIHFLQVIQEIQFALVLWRVKFFFGGLLYHYISTFYNHLSCFRMQKLIIIYLFAIFKMLQRYLNMQDFAISYLYHIYLFLLKKIDIPMYPVYKINLIINKFKMFIWTTTEQNR